MWLKQRDRPKYPGFSILFIKIFNMGCCYFSFKNLTILINLIFLFLGLGVIGVGTYLLVSEKSYFLANTFPISFLALGSTLALISFLGCCGAANDKKWILTIYIVLIALIIIAEVVIGTVAYTNKEKVEPESYKLWQDAYYHHNSSLLDFEKTVFFLLPIGDSINYIVELLWIQNCD
jgi:Tetraspanin family